MVGWPNCHIIITNTKATATRFMIPLCTRLTLQPVLCWWTSVFLLHKTLQPVLCWWTSVFLLTLDTKVVWCYFFTICNILSCSGSSTCSHPSGRCWLPPLVLHITLVPPTAINLPWGLPLSPSNCCPLTLIIPLALALVSPLPLALLLAPLCDPLPLSLPLSVTFSGDEVNSSAI